MKPGDVYKHWKSGKYEIVCIAQDAETCEDMVVYKSLTDGRLWVRTMKRFTTVMASGVCRFTREIVDGE